MEVFLLQTGMLPFSGPLAILSCSRPDDTCVTCKSSFSIAQACAKLPDVLNLFARSWSLSRPFFFLCRQSARSRLLLCLQCWLQCLALHRHHTNICWVCDYINIRVVMIRMLITWKIATWGRVSAFLFFFFKAGFLSKVMSSRVDLQRTYKKRFQQLWKTEQKIQVCFYNELCSTDPNKLVEWEWNFCFFFLMKSMQAPGINLTATNKTRTSSGLAV